MVPSKNIFFFSLFCPFQEVFDIADFVVKWAQTTLGWTLMQVLSEGVGWLEVGRGGNREGGRATKIQGEKSKDVTRVGHFSRCTNLR